MSEQREPTKKEWKEYYLWRDRQDSITLTVYEWLAVKHYPKHHEH